MLVLLWLIVLVVPFFWPLALHLFAYSFSYKLEAYLVLGDNRRRGYRVEDLRPQINLRSFVDISILGLVWFSPSLLSSLALFLSLWYKGSLETAFTYGIIKLILFTAVMPTLLLLQLVAFPLIPISIMRYVEERDLGYALNLGELLLDLDLMKDGFWRAILHCALEALLIALPLGILFLPSILVLSPIALIGYVYLISLFSLAVELVRFTDRIVVIYINRVYRPKA